MAKSQSSYCSLASSPPWPSHSLTAGTTTLATTPATLTPPGLTTGKGTGQAIGCHQTATLTGSATTQATLTPLGLIPGRAMGPLGKAKEETQASTILRWTMIRSLKAAAAAAQAAKDRQFRAFQEELGLSLDNDGEASLQAPPRRLPHGAQLLNLPSNMMGGTGQTSCPDGAGPLLLGPDSHPSPSVADVGF